MKDAEAADERAISSCSRSNCGPIATVSRKMRRNHYKHGHFIPRLKGLPVCVFAHISEEPGSTMSFIDGLQSRSKRRMLFSTV
jgi:hypothetical protein